MWTGDLWICIAISKRLHYIFIWNWTSDFILLNHCKSIVATSYWHGIEINVHYTTLLSDTRLVRLLSGSRFKNNSRCTRGIRDFFVKIYDSLAHVPVSTVRVDESKEWNSLIPGRAFISTLPAWHLQYYWDMNHFKWIFDMNKK